MGPIAQVVSVSFLLALTGCSAGEDLATAPPFATGVPGNAVFVTWGDGVSQLLDAAGLARSVAPVESLSDMLVDGGDAQWFVLPDAAETWPNLATSMPFRRALAEVPEHVAGAAFIDLQQLVDNGLSTLLEGIPRSSRLVQSLGLEAFQFAVAWAGAEGEVRSVVRSTGRSTGISAMLTGPLGPSLLGDPEPGQNRIELRVEPEVVSRMIEALSSDDLGVEGAMFNQMSQTLRSTLRKIQPHLGGRVSLLLGEEGVPVIACSVVDRAGLELGLQQFFGQPRDGGLKLLGGRYAHIEDERIVVTADDGEDPPPVGTRQLEGALWATLPRLGLTLEISRRDPANLEVAVRRGV